jgi:hypothetical protein
MADIIEQSYQAANSLAAKLTDYPWYHRTSTCDERDCLGDWRIVLEVWVEGKGHDEIPKEWCGFKVRVNQVTKQHPCPFGSVKPDPKEGKGNKV